MAKGALELSVPLRLKSGPTVMLHLKATLVAPDLTVSTSNMDFGLVQSGKCKVRRLVTMAALPAQCLGLAL